MNKAYRPLLIIGIAIVLTTMFLSGPRNEKPDPNLPMWWVVYQAQTDEYVVEIDESQRGDQEYPVRIVHLNNPTNSLVGLTGHDYEMDGQWDRVFWSGYDKSRSGCNSYIRTNNGKWVYDPCFSDEDSAPIPEHEILTSLKKIDTAMAYRTFENINRVWTYKSRTDMKRPSMEQARVEK